MKKQTAYILIAALLVLQFYFVFRINALQNMVQNTNKGIDYIESQLDNQLSSIYENIDKKLKEQASLIHNSFTKTGKLDVADLTVPVTFTVEPKKITETMSVSLDFNGEIVQLEKSGLEYSATKNFKISDSISPKIIIEDNGVKNIEEAKGLRVNLEEQIFPYISARFSGEWSYGSNEYRAKGQLNIDYKPSHENNPVTDLKYVIKVNDEIIKETPVEMEKNGREGGTFTLDIDDNYSINEGQILTSSVVATDNLGFTHEYLVTHFVAGSKAQREPYFEQVEITAPNGEVVYSYDESNYDKID